MTDAPTPHPVPIRWTYSIQPSGITLATFLGDVVIDGVLTVIGGGGFTKTFTGAFVPGSGFDSSQGVRPADLFVNTALNISPGTAELYINNVNTLGAAKWGGLGYFDANNNFLWGNGVYGSAFTTANQNILIGNLAGRSIATGTDNVVVGATAGQSAVGNIACILIGTGAGQSTTAEEGHIFIGRNAGQLANAPGAGGQNWSVIVGDNAGTNVLQTSDSVIIGRGAAFRGTTLFNALVAIGHGAAFYGDNLQSVIAIGNGAGGNPIDGSGSNYGTNADNNAIFVGAFAGKASNAARTNVLALGANATVGIKDNTAVLGASLTDFSTTARIYSGGGITDVPDGAGTTLTGNAIVTGRVKRTGPGGAFNDTLATAQQIVQGGPGNGVSTGMGFEWKYANLTASIATLLAPGGGGITITGTATVAAGTTAIFWVSMTNTTLGAEAVTFERLNA